MLEAIKEAKITLEEGNWHIGCVIVIGNDIIARAHNKEYSEENRMAHTEMIALEKGKPTTKLIKEGLLRTWEDL